VPVPKLGVYVDVDLDVLVERIIIGPALPSPDQDAIRDATKAAGLLDRVSKSSLLGTPRYVQ